MDRFYYILTILFSYNMDFPKKAFVQPYMGLFHELQDQKQNNFILPTFPYTWFDAGFALYVFNCDQDHGYGSSSGNDEIGSIELTGVFGKAPTKNLLFLVMLSFEHSYEIDIHRNVKFLEKPSKNIKAKSYKRFRN